VLTGTDGTCDDTIGNYPNPNGLDIVSKSRYYPQLVGQRVNAVTGVIEREMINFPVGYHPGPTDPRSVFPALTTLQKSNYAWSILERTNPSAPDVSLPTFVAEFRDIPSLIKNWYGLLHKVQLGKLIRNELTWLERNRQLDRLITRSPELLAAGHLTWSWVIRPFIRDVSLMCDFVFLTQKRMMMLRQLKANKVLRRRVQLASNYQLDQQPNQILHSEGVVLKGTRRTVFTEKTWGTVRYRIPTPTSWFFYEDAKLCRMAKQLVYGITTHEALATAWELMPWSWFVDWFTGVGKVIKATNNTLGLVHSDCCLMRHTLSESEFDINWAASEKWARPQGEFYERFERKERFVVAPIIPFAPTTLPLFELKTMSILGSLAVLQTKPGRTVTPKNVQNIKKALYSLVRRR